MPPALIPQLWDYLRRFPMYIPVKKANVTDKMCTLAMIQKAVVTFIIQNPDMHILHDIHQNIYQNVIHNLL